MRRLLLLLPLLAGCQQAMGDEPRYEPYEASDFFADGGASRVPPKGTVPRGYVVEGTEARMPSDVSASGPYPVPLTAATLSRGQERYRIYCAPCHGFSGYGDGVIPSRGFPTPPSFHEARLRSAPPAHFVDVITHGYGAMYPYAARVSPDERWAIAAYIKALQLSRHATPADVPASAVVEGVSP